MSHLPDQDPRQFQLRERNASLVPTVPTGLARKRFTRLALFGVVKGLDGAVKGQPSILDTQVGERLSDAASDSFNGLQAC